jgi:hypothetical protein
MITAENIFRFETITFKYTRGCARRGKPRTYKRMTYLIR